MKEQMSQEEYTKQDGQVCPFCHTKYRLDAGRYTHFTGGLVQEVECQACGATFDDVYELTAYEVTG